MLPRTASLSPTILDALIETLRNLNSSRYTCAAGLVVMLYDWLLMLPSEVELLWARRKGYTSILYLLNRYVPIPFMLIVNYQIAGLRSNVSIQLYVAVLQLASGSWLYCPVVNSRPSLYLVLWARLSLTISTWLLSLRVISLWRQNKSVAYSVYTLYVIMQAVTWTLTCISMNHIYPTITYYQQFKVCGASNVDVVGGAYFAPIAFELFIFSLQIIHHFRHANVSRQHNLPKFHLLSTLYQDGYIYFVVVVSLRVMTAVVWAAAPHSLWYMSTQLEFGLMVTLTSRFHLNLRLAAIPHDHSLTTSTSFTFNHSYQSAQTASMVPQIAKLTQSIKPHISLTSSEENAWRIGGKEREEMDGEIVLAMERAETRDLEMANKGAYELGTMRVVEDRKTLAPPDGKVRGGVEETGSLSIDGDIDARRWVWPHRATVP